MNGNFLDIITILRKTRNLSLILKNLANTNIHLHWKWFVPITLRI